MFSQGAAQPRSAFSLLFGTPFDPGPLERLVDAFRRTRPEPGRAGPEVRETPCGGGPNEPAPGEAQLGRFRAQARRAARGTVYYRGLFAGLGLDPAHLSYEQISRIPLTTNDALRARPDDFVLRAASPILRVATTGTTRTPTLIHFSHDELRSYKTLGAKSLLSRGLVGPRDVVQISTSSRAVLGNACFAGACELAGALVHQAGMVSAEHTLSLLTRRRPVDGKRDRVSVLSVYPSHLGEVIELGQRLGLGPADFGLHAIFTGGELVTAGLKARARRLFGDVWILEGYGMTETWPVAGVPCPEGHLHFEPSQALVEVLDFETGRPAGPGRLGTLVVTPFAPYRQTTILLRYDTGDVVRTLVAPPDCALRHLPATGQMLGKLELSVRHDGGWTFPRDVIEALEALDAVPLPARFGFWSVPGGGAVEVVTRRGDEPATRRTIERSLGERGVPVRQLRLLTRQSDLRRPFPRRADLRERPFGQPADDGAPGPHPSSAVVLALVSA
jgi:phenylacetate-coenzyme A ligase PaaK-like adenylate-forming protein